MSTAKKLEIHDPTATKARLSPGRQWIGIKNLEAPDELQPRAGIDKDWVSQLEGFRRDGSEFPPARVYQLADGRLMLAEGHHRRWALLGAGESDMLCEVVDGTMEDATEHAAGSNKSNGVKPMGPKDVTKAIEMLLSVGAWQKRSALMIARKVGCSPAKATLLKKLWFRNRGTEIPDEEINGSFRKATIWNPRQGGYPPIFTKKDPEGGESHGVRCKVFRKWVTAKTEPELKARVDEILNDRVKQKRTLNSSNLRSLLKPFGFKSLGHKTVSSLKMACLWGPGVICTWADLEGANEIYACVGLLNILSVAAGKLKAAQRLSPLDSRLVIIGYKDCTNNSIIELFEDAGYEFMTPDELIKSLGVNGMTPDEVMASLQEKQADG